MQTTEDALTLAQDYEAVMAGGLDPNALDGQGRALLTRIYQNARYINMDWVTQATLDLLERGATLTQHGGEPFRHLLCLASTSGGNGLFQKVLGQLLRRENERPLHMVARLAPGLLLPWLDLGATQNPTMRHWLQQHDENGFSVAHNLWRDDSLLVEHARQAIEAEQSQADERTQDALAKLWLGTMRVCWRAQEAIGDAGTTMAEVAGDGRSVMDLCIERVEAQEALCFPNSGVCASVSAEIERRALEARTPIVVPGPGRGGRL